MNKKLIRLTESDLHKIVKESAKRIMKEVALKGKSGKTYSLHGTDPESWAVMSRLRGKNGYFPNTPQHYHACRDEDNWIELDDKAHPNLRSRNNANRINAMMNRIDDKSKDIMAANESKLSRIVKESVNRILREDERHAWNLTDDGIDEFGMDSGYPTPETAKKYHAVYDNDYIGRKIDMARAMGQDQASGRDWMQNVHDPKHGSKFTNDDPRFRFARDYVNHGKYFPLGYSGGKYFDDNAEDDLKAFNKSEHNKQAAADRRWMKAADSRPLYRKNSPNNDIPR